MQKTFSVLHEKALECTKTYLEAERDLIEVLQEIDRCKGYRELEFRNLFEYATQALGLSRDVSYNLITVARKAAEIPLLQEKIQNQEISLSHARAIAPILTLENQEHWIEVAQTSSKRELEKEIVRVYPEKQAKERVKYVTESVMELRTPISEKLHEKLKRIQDLVSTQQKKSANIEAALEAMANLFLEKNDPLKKAERAQERKTDRPAQPKIAPGREDPRFIPAKLEHAVRLRDQDRCTHESRAGRCRERRWLEIHHIQPLSHGGETTFENLKLLCRGHHQVLHADHRLFAGQYNAPGIKKVADTFL